MGTAPERKLDWMSTRGSFALEHQALSAILRQAENAKHWRKEERGKMNGTGNDFIYEIEFSEWYGIYPRHVARRAAEKAYRAARKRGATREQLLEAATKYRSVCCGRQPQFVKHPATWLNGDCYLDDPVEFTSPSASVSEPGRPFYGLVSLDKI